MTGTDEMQKRIDELELQLAEMTDRCEELGYDKARYFRLYEMACIELQNVKKQTCVAEIKIKHSDIDGETIQILSCELEEGIHKLYNHPLHMKAIDYSSHVAAWLCQLQTGN